MKEPNITMNIPNFTSFVETMQNEYQPEISVIFQNSKPTSFDRKTEKQIEDITGNYFIEFIAEDLSLETAHNWSSQGQSLLSSGDEKTGVARLHEAL